MTESQRVAVGQKVQFDPFADDKGFGIGEVRGNTTGTVIAVYPAHKWFSVVYGKHKTRTSFKFCDIGRRVKILG